MSSKPPKTSTRDDVMSFLDSLENPPKSSSPPSLAHQAAAVNSVTSLTDTQSVLDFLDEIGSSGNSGVVPAASLQPPSTVGTSMSTLHKFPTTPNPTPIITPSMAAAPSPVPFASRPASGNPPSSQNDDFQDLRSVPVDGAMVTPSDSKIAPATDPAGKAWSWGSLLAAGVSAIKSSEEAFKKSSEAALKGVAAEGEKMKGYVNKDALGKIGDDLKKLGTTVVNTIAPPIEVTHKHPRVVCYVEEDSARDWLGACAFRMFHASLEECPAEVRGKLRTVDVDVESAPVGDLPQTVARGLDESVDKAKTRVGQMVSTHSISSSEPASPTAPAVWRLYVAVQPYAFSTKETSEFSAFCVTMVDPARGFHLVNFSQGVPVNLLAALNEDERRDCEIETVEGSVKILWREWIWRCTSI